MSVEVAKSNYHRSPDIIKLMVEIDASKIEVLVDGKAESRPTEEEKMAVVKFINTQHLLMGAVNSSWIKSANYYRRTIAPDIVAVFKDTTKTDHTHDRSLDIYAENGLSLPLNSHYDTDVKSKDGTVQATIRVARFK